MPNRQHLVRVATDSGGDTNGLSEFVAGSTDGGPLIPAYTETQRDAISTATEGMIIYNTTLNKFQGYENGSWANLI